MSASAPGPASRVGHQERLAQWVDEYAPRLYRAAALFTSQDEARDLCQEVFLVAARTGSSFAEQSTPYTWLYAILRNLVWDRRRKSARRARGVPLERPLPVLSPEQEARRREDRRRVRRAVAELPEMQREVVSLFYLQERSVGEVALQMGVPVGTVKSRLFSARTALKRALEGAGVD